MEYTVLWSRLSYPTNCAMGLGSLILLHPEKELKLDPTVQTAASLKLVFKPKAVPKKLYAPNLHAALGITTLPLTGICPNPGDPSLPFYRHPFWTTPKVPWGKGWSHYMD